MHWRNKQYWRPKTNEKLFADDNKAKLIEKIVGCFVGADD